VGCETAFVGAFVGGTFATAFVGLKVLTAEGATVFKTAFVGAAVGVAAGLVEGKGVGFTAATRAPVTR